MDAKMDIEKINFTVEGEYIDLLQLLKATGIASTGGHAKMIVDNGEVERNGEVEMRKRAKLKAGDVLRIDRFEIQLA